jgi:hypothetical protein
MLEKVFEEPGQLNCQPVLKDLSTRLQIIQFRICVLGGSTVVSAVPDDHMQIVIVGVFMEASHSIWTRNSHSIGVWRVSSVPPLKVLPWRTMRVVYEAVSGAPLFVYSSSIPSGNLIVCSVKFAIDSATRENVEVRLVLNTPIDHLARLYAAHFVKKIKLRYSLKNLTSREIYPNIARLILHIAKFIGPIANLGAPTYCDDK